MQKFKAACESFYIKEDSSQKTSKCKMQCESCLKTIKNYFVYCRCNNLEHKYTVFTCFCLNELKFKTCDVCRQYIEKDRRKGRFHKNQYCQEEFQNIQILYTV